MTVELPAIDNLSLEQRARLLARLIEAELAEYPVPMPIVVRREDESVIGIFSPRIVPPAQSTPYPLTPEEREEIIRLARNPGRTFTSQELRVLELSDDDALR